MTLVDAAGGTWLLIVLVVGGFSYSSDFRTATLCQQAETKIVQAVVSAMVKTKPVARDASMTKSDDQKRETARRERLEKRAMKSISSTCIEISQARKKDDLTAYGKFGLPER